jgi:hypothetical protein
MMMDSYPEILMPRLYLSKKYNLTRMVFCKDLRCWIDEVITCSGSGTILMVFHMDVAHHSF